MGQGTDFVPFAGELIYYINAKLSVRTDDGDFH
jgi:hypothetical protein